MRLDNMRKSGQAHLCFDILVRNRRAKPKKPTVEQSEDEPEVTLSAADRKRLPRLGNYPQLIYELLSRDRAIRFVGVLDAFE
jgi:hypothetical protein